MVSVDHCIRQPLNGQGYSERKEMWQGAVQAATEVLGTATGYRMVVIAVFNCSPPFCRWDRQRPNGEINVHLQSSVVAISLNLFASHLETLYYASMMYMDRSLAS